MKRKIIMTFLVLLSLVACSTKQDDSNKEVFTLKAEVLEVLKDDFLVAPIEKSEELGEQLIVTRKPKKAKKKLDFEVGDIVVITHDSLILQSDPAQLAVVYDIKKE